MGDAIKKRKQVAKIGGIVLTATSIASHVVPQIKQIEQNNSSESCLLRMKNPRPE